MPNDASNTRFQSVLAPFMDQFLQEKHACGYAYHEPIRILHRLDGFLVQEGLTTLELPRSTARNWLAKKPHESASSQQQRITLIPSDVFASASSLIISLRPSACEDLS